MGIIVLPKVFFLSEGRLVLRMERRTLYMLYVIV